MNSEKKKGAELHMEESPNTLKTRERLRKELEDNKNFLTPQALEKKVSEIQAWIATHAHQRVVLREKGISLFDENQNAAKMSTKITQFAEQLRCEGPSCSLEDE